MTVLPVSRHLAPSVKSVTILGSTGSIGQSAVKLIEQSHGAFTVTALTAQNNIALLIEQAKKLRPQLAVIENEAHYPTLKEALSSSGIKSACGQSGLLEAAALPTGIVLSAIVGTAGLYPTLEAIKHGTTIALANKECLVTAGEILTKQAAQSGATILPVDSEHNALFQLFDFEHPERIEKITLTASGGPFRMLDIEAMRSVTPEQAVKHPNWSMGAKISVDSATMMNKGLELIEAYHLFPMQQEQIDIIVHPESIIHGMVHYRDGSVLAQMGCPDMCIPISYALAWPDRFAHDAKRLNLTELGTLSFFTPDTAKFPALRVAREALTQGGNAPVILNAANEIAVQAFLTHKIGFTDIVAHVENTLARLPHTSIASLEEVMYWDTEARQSTP